MAERPALSTGARTFVLLAAVASLGATAIPACFGRDCDGDVISWGNNDGEGHLVDENTWESTPTDFDWIQYSHERVIVFNYGRLLGAELTTLEDGGTACQRRVPDWTIAYVSAAQRPNSRDPNSYEDYTIASGNIGKYRIRAGGTLDLYNNTCSNFYARLVVHAPPVARPLPPNTECDPYNVVVVPRDGGPERVSEDDLRAFESGDAGDAGAP